MASESREFLLLAGLCRSAFIGRDGSPPPGHQTLDWPRFLRLARFHRVQGVVARGLEVRRDIQALVPAAVAREIGEDARQIAAANLLMAEECRALSARFASAGLPVLFVIGLTLGMLAYGDIATKSAVDIDLLIEPYRLADAAAVLEANRYQRVHT